MAARPKTAKLAEVPRLTVAGLAALAEAADKKKAEIKEVTKKEDLNQVIRGISNTIKVL